MTLDRCHHLEQGLRSPNWTDMVGGSGTWLSGLADIEDCIADGLRHMAEAEDWRMFERYVIAGYYRPHASYAGLLCRVLAQRRSDVNNEDIVDALAEARNPESVSCLRDTLEWEPPWDEFRNLGVKCVWALASIGTPEAIAVLKEAARNPAFKVREAATRVLNRMGARDE